MKLFRVLNFVLCYVIENNVFTYYLCCQSKTLSAVCYDKILADMSYNELLGIVIP